MVPIATDTTTNIDQLQLAVSGRLPAHDTPVPFIDNFKPEASWAPPDSKYGKTNLHDLKSSFIFKKEITQTIVHPGGFGSHPQATGHSPL